MRPSRVPMLLCLLVSLHVLGGAPLEAQVMPERDLGAGMITGFGYSGVLPEVVAGVGAWRFLGDRGIGVFLDGKMTTPRFSRRSDYCPDALEECTVPWVSQNRPADAVLRDENEWLIFNLGGMYVLTPEFAVLLGAGTARRHRLREFVDDAAGPDDPREPITERGTYFVDHPPGAEWKIQGVVGALLRAGPHLTFRFGYESGPGGMSIGAYLVP